MDATLSGYIPIDRRQALANGTGLPEQTTGAALLADIAGFTPLTEALAQALGPQRGAEEIIALLNQVYDALVDAVHSYGGSVVVFSGDAITCWFDDLSWELDSHARPSAQDSPSPAALRATASALAMQQAMRAFAAIPSPTGQAVTLAVKVAVVQGPIRRLLVGDPAIQRLEVLAGRTLDRLAAIQHQAASGEVLLDAATARQLDGLIVAVWHKDAQASASVAAVTGLTTPVARQPWLSLPAGALRAEQCRPWVLPAVAARLQHQPDSFLAELRPAVALMLQFGGLDYDGDDTVGDKLDAFIRWVQQVVAHHDGALIDLTIGDRGNYLYAAWGAPLAHDDDAARALAAAHELLARPSALASIADIRIGLARGTMRAGSYGSPERRTYGVLGDATNLAFRLMTQAPVGAIWCDAGVARAAERHWSFVARPPVRVKGKAGLVPVYLPEGAHGRRPVAPSTDALVGRQDEVARLAQALDAVIAGQSRVVLLDGEAGIGKSRLVSELARLARARGLVELQGAGQSIGRQTPYHAWRDVFTTYFGLDDVPHLADRQARVYAAVQPHLIERLALLNEVLNLGFPDTPLTRALDDRSRNESLRSLLIELLRLWAREQPLVLMLEDVHWLDSLSWELAVEVARTLTAEKLPLFLLVATRPLDERHLMSQQLNALMELAATRMSLQMLDIADTVKLAAARLGVDAATMPESVVALVQARSGGNPFFVEELVATLRERGMIRLEPDDDAGPAARLRCVVNTDLGRAGQVLPDTLQGLLLARIDRLGVEEQLTLKVAAVIGPVFAYPLLYHARTRHAALEEQGLRRQLGALVAQDFTALEATEPDLTYRFKHILTQEAAYGTLLFAQRRALHQTVAAWYEQASSATLPESERSQAEPLPLSVRSPYLPLLAYHYGAAEDVERERHYAHLAGIQAAEQYAKAEATAHFTRALALTPQADLALRFDLLLARVDAYPWHVDRADIEEDLATLHTLAEQLDDNTRRVAVLLRRLRHPNTQDVFTEIVHVAEQTVRLAEAVGSTVIAAEAHYRWGWRLISYGDYAAAYTSATALVRLARTTQDLRTESLAWSLFGSIAVHQEDYSVAETALQECLRLVQLIEDRYAEAACLGNLGRIALSQGNYTKARTCYEQAMRTADLVGRNQAGNLHQLGTIAAGLGDYQNARSYYLKSLQMAQIRGDQRHIAENLFGLSYIDGLQGDHTSALALAQQALAIARTIGHRGFESEALLALGHAQLTSGDDPQAIITYTAALELYRALNRPTEATAVQAGLARAAWAIGDMAEAVRQVEAILAGFDAGMQPVSFQVDLTCYEVLGAIGDPRAPAVLETAHTRLQARAATIPDDLTRYMFLERVPWHRELVAAWAAQQGA